MFAHKAFAMRILGNRPIFDLLEIAFAFVVGAVLTTSCSLKSSKGCSRCWGLANSAAAHCNRIG